MFHLAIYHVKKFPHRMLHRCIYILFVVSRIYFSSFNRSRFFLTGHDWSFREWKIRMSGKIRRKIAGNFEYRAEHPRRGCNCLTYTIVGKQRALRCKLAKTP